QRRLGPEEPRRKDHRVSEEEPLRFWSLAAPSMRALTRSNTHRRSGRRSTRPPDSIEPPYGYVSTEPIVLMIRARHNARHEDDAPTGPRGIPLYHRCVQHRGDRAC